MAWQRRAAKLLPLFPNRHRSYFSPCLHPFAVASGNEDVEAGTVLAVAPSWKHHQGKKDMVANIHLVALAFLLVPTLVGPVSAQAVVGDAPMYAGKGIVDNAVNSKEHATPIAATQAAGVVDILKEPGPFAALPARLVDTFPK